MIEPAAYRFLLHHTPPPGLGLTPSLLCCSPAGDVGSISLSQLSQVNFPIITHSFSLLVDWFRRESLPLPKVIVDLETAKKLLVGRPKTDFGSETPWDMPSMVLDLVPPGYDPKQVRASLTTHIAKPSTSDFSSLRCMKAVAARLPQLWTNTRTDLYDSREIHRFDDVEVPAYNAMLEAQYKGIRVDTDRRDAFLESIEEEYVSAHHELAIHRKIDVDRAFVDIDYLCRVIAVPVRNAEVFSQPRDIIKARSYSDPICSLLGTVDTARGNKRILLRTGMDDGQCYPLFDTIGTVTGRILAVDPHLQHVSKKYRGIIAPRPGHKLVYLDYAQFEPNIMASISRDPVLSQLCSDGDIYERLSKELCGSVQYRDTVKTMFLAYSYGKDATSLTEFLVDCDFPVEQASRVIEGKFIPLFVGIEKWKASIEDLLSYQGRIGTLFGNYRYRDVHGELNARERRWAVSQVIQGTGSLILKRAIIEIKKKLPEVSILLPMHDALLVEIPETSASEIVEELLTQLRRTFIEICPFVLPSVKVKPFA